MGKSRFVNPGARETVRLELSDDDWVEVKDRLTNREQRRINTAGFHGLKGEVGKKGGDVEIEVDWESMEFERVWTYVVGWSFKDDHEQPVQLNRENFERLDSASFDEIKEALDRHLEAKNSKPGTAS